MSQPIQPTAPVNAIVSIQPLSLAVPNRDATATPNPLANLPVGSTLEGFVVNRDAHNNPILRTAVGDVLVHSDVFLKTGSTVLLRVDATQDSRARIVTVDGQDVESYARQNTPAPLTKDTIAQQPLQSGLVRPAPVPGGAPPSPFPLLEALVLTSTGSAPNPQRTAQRPTLQFSPNTPVQLTVLDVELPPLPVALSSVPEVKLPASLLPPLPNAAAPQSAAPQTAPQPGATPVTTPTPATIPATNPAFVPASSAQQAESSIPAPPLETQRPAPAIPMSASSVTPAASPAAPSISVAPASISSTATATPGPVQQPATSLASPLPAQQTASAVTVPSFIATPPAVSLPEIAQEVDAPVPPTLPQAMTAYRAPASMGSAPTQTPLPFAHAAVPHYAPPDALSDGTPTPANAVIATVIGHEADGANILQTSFATIKLYTQQPMPTGTHLTVQVTATPHGAEPLIANPLSSELQKITSWTQDWPTLGEVVNLLGHQPDVLNGMLERIPTIGPKLTSNVLFFLSAIRRGSVEGWLDKRTLRALESDAPSLLARLKLDMANMQQLFTDSPLKDWTGAMIPMLFGQEIHQTRLYIRQDDGQGVEKASGNGQRFILEVTMSQLGEIQLDGFMRSGEKPTRQFDLIIRTEQALPSEVSQGIRETFSNAISSGKLEGQIGFQHGSQHFVRPLADKKTPPEEGFQQPILA